MIASSGLFTSGVPTNSGGVERLWGRSPRTAWGTLTDGDFEFDGVSINEIRRATNGVNFRLLKNGGTGFNTYFAVGGGGENARFYILTAEITIDFGAVANILAPSGGNFFNFTLPDSAGWRSALSSIDEGDLFIMGWTVPSTTSALAAAANASIEVGFAATAPATLGAAPVHTPLAATANADLEVNLAATAPATLGDAPTEPPLAATAAASFEVRLAVDAPASRGEAGALAAAADASFEVRLAVAAPARLVDPTAKKSGEDLAVELDAAISELLAGGGVSATATNLPPGVVFSSASRILSGTPTRAGAWMVTYTITASGGAETVDRFLIGVHPAGEPQYAILVDWDGDGGFAHPLTDTFADLTKGGVRTRRGRNYASMIYGRTVAGTLEATLVNYAGQYDRFASNSDLAGVVLPRRRLIFVMAWEDATYRLWTGFLDKVDKKARTGGNDVVMVLATDIIGDLARADCGVSYREDVTVEAAVGAVLDAAGIADGDRGEINGDTELGVYFATDAKALLHLRQLEEAEAGFLWVTGGGQVRFDGVNDRYVQTRSRQVQVEITDEEDYGADALPLLPPPREVDPTKDLANIVEARVRKWGAETEADLWTLPEVVQLDAGAVRTFLVSTSAEGASGRDPKTGRYLSFGDLAIREWIEPAANMDYTANTSSDGNGTDRTGNVGVTFEGAGTSARLTLENEHATDTINITMMKVRGRVLAAEPAVTLELRDEDSIADFGPRPYTVASDLLGSVNDANTYAQYILLLYAQPTRKADVRVSMSDQRERIGTMEISDRVEYDARGISTDMYIESIGHVLRPGLRHDMSFTLSQAGLLDDVIILGTGPGLGTGILGA